MFFFLGFQIPWSFTAWGQNLGFCNTSDSYTCMDAAVWEPAVDPNENLRFRRSRVPSKVACLSCPSYWHWGSRDAPLLSHFLDQRFLPLSRSISGLLPGSPTYLGRHEGQSYKFERAFLFDDFLFKFQSNWGFLPLYPSFKRTIFERLYCFFLINLHLRDVHYPVIKRCGHLWTGSKNICTGKNPGFFFSSTYIAGIFEQQGIFLEFNITW